MEIELCGQFTEQDIKRALALGLPRSFQAMRILVTVGFGVPSIGALIMSIRTASQIPLEPIPLLVNFLPPLLFLAFLGFLVYAMWLLPRFQVRRLREAPLFQGTFRGVATDETLELRSETNESKVRWTAFLRYKMSDDIILLYQNDAAFNIVPRHLLVHGEEWQLLQQHVRSVVPAEAPKATSRRRWFVYAVIFVVVILGVLWGLLGKP